MTDYTTLGDRELLDAILHAEEQAAAIERAIKQAKEEFLHRRRSDVAAAYAAKGNQFGIIHLEDDEYSIGITTATRTEWDQGKLAALAGEIRDQWKADPAEYIESKLSVKESKYKAWPSDLRAKFESARTVKASAPSLTVAIKE